MKLSRPKVNAKTNPLQARISLRLGCLLAAAMSSNLHAQGPVLEEVIVTAQKRTESMQDVPVAVSALAGDDLLNTGFRDVGDVAAQVPSLIVTSNASPLNTSFRIRRIGNEGNIPTFEPDTALVIDGAFRSRSGLGLGDMVDVKSVEVLKGPQSTLYGKNAGAGVISITTQGPTNEFEGMLEASAGSETFRSLKASVNIPITDNFATRFSYSGTERDPLVENLTGPDSDDQSGYAVRGQFRLDITDSLTAKLILGRMIRDMKPVTGDVQHSAAHLEIVANAGATITNNRSDDRIVEQDDRTNFDMQSDDAVLSFEYQGDGYTFSAITGLEDYDVKINMEGVEQIPLDIVTFNDSQAGQSVSQELRWASDNGSDFNWLFGLFYYDNTFTRGADDQHEFILNEFIEEYGGAVAGGVAGVPGLLAAPILGVEGDTGDFDVNQDTMSSGVFTQLGYRLTEQMDVAFGLRYSYEEKTGSVVQFNETSAAGCVPPLDKNLVCTVSPNGNDFEQSDTWSAVTGNINLSYAINDDSMIYATYSIGFKAGGYSLQFGGASDEIRPFDQEDITNLEFGWKTELFDRRVRLNGAVFHAEYEEFQNASFIGLVFAVNNAEMVVVDGIEVDSVWLLTENLTANVNLAYIEATYDEYTGGQCYYGREPDDAALAQCDLSGNILPFAPKGTGNIALQWEQPLADGDIYSRLDVRYTGAANYSSDLDPRHAENALTTANFRLGWRNADFDVATWVNNLNDDVVYVQHVAANVATAIDVAVGSPEGSYQSYIGAPRTYGLTFRAFF